MFAEQVELPRVAFVACGRGGLVVTAYLGEVGRLELQGELHQRIGDGGGLIGDVVSGRSGWALARHRGRSGPYSSISSFMRKLLPSMMTVSAW
jgi:hypothetical protein